MPAAYPPRTGAEPSASPLALLARHARALLDVKDVLILIDAGDGPSRRFGGERDAGAPAATSVPIHVDGRTAGTVVAVPFEEGRTLDEAELATLRDIAELAAPLLRRASPQAPKSPPRRYGQALAGALDQVARPPALAEARRRVMRAVHAGGNEAVDAAGAIEADIGLAVAVIGAANRSPRRGRSPLASVHDAVEVLTAEELEQAVTDCPTVEFFDRAGEGRAGVQSLAMHSAASRTAADMVARAIDFPGREELRLAALLHDAGKLVLEIAWDGFAAVDDVRRTPAGRRIERERRLLGIDHAMVSALAVRRWGLPDRIAVVVEAHHSPAARGPAAMVRLADMLAHYAHGNAVAPRELAEAAHTVEMDRATLARLMYEISRAPHLSSEARSRSPLAPMQTRVLGELSNGKRYKEIAATLGISESTVRSHAHMTYRKLGVADRAQAVLLATRRGWL